MKLYRLLIIVACALPAAASAQWQWVDHQGRRVFSDQPPPSDIPEANIKRRPGRGSGGVAPASTQAPVPAQAEEGAAPKTGLDKKLEQQVKQKKEAEEAKQREEEERIARLKADSCARARQAMTSLQSGVRIASTNAQGERIFLDEAGIAAETRRVQTVIDSDCVQ